jgi:hypothetical protein
VYRFIDGVELPEQPLGRLVGSYQTKREIDQRGPWLLAAFKRSEKVSQVTRMLFEGMRRVYEGGEVELERRRDGQATSAQKKKVKWKNVHWIFTKPDENRRYTRINN